MAKEKAENQDATSQGLDGLTSDDFDDAISDLEAEALAAQALEEAGLSGKPDMTLPDFGGMNDKAAESSIALLNDVELDVKVELGRTEMEVDQVLRLNAGSVIELDKLAGDPVDILVNEQLVARGEVLVINDNFCVRINEIIPGVSQTAAQNAR